ncbi:DoxX family protein [Effusibacillus lacus]|uniref:Oxidoreductase n=1 Tax=Effusibacillus lacus TaxID=1348429 RepID=A0A292YEI6_9BACL|nr:DoxX family protein [Effusibacillus lacus]TCS74952.1 putative membrane protein YphA (DoxX/SURF4 family) [Effusibacillus lacus]GAX91622.1 oxidoreductase [Effusibacillus lacus]
MSKKNEWGALILRVVLGITFLAHGISKFQMGVGNIAGWFGSIGLPGFLAYVVATLELVGGIALIIGLGTRFVSALLGIVMIGAIFKVKLSAGLLGSGQSAGYELDLALLAMASYLFMNGSILYSFDSLFHRSGKNEIDASV